MSDATKIEWADSTFNPWVGCTKISAACDHCYAEEWAKRFGQVRWGDNPRKRTSDANWRKPRKWNAEAEKSGKPHFVFCASLADVFDNQVATSWRRDLWEQIAATPHLTWLLLTKRPQNIARMLPDNWGKGWPNVWLGTTVENQEVANRNIPALLAVPAVKRFLSCEPLLGPINLSQCVDADDGFATYTLDWVIAGGESGPNARPSHPDWFRSLRDQCARADVPFLFKQWGEWIEGRQTDDSDGCVRSGRMTNRGNLDRLHIFDDGAQMLRAGKKSAGRLLDGVQHDGRPEA